MYPIRKLDRNINHILHDIISADIEGNVNKGLQNQIDFFDEDDHISGVANIVKNPIDSTCRVMLSEAFCQFLWFICDICLKEIDLSIIKEECAKVNGTLDQYKQEVETILQNPMRYFWLFLQQHPNLSSVQYLDYLHRSTQLLDVNQYTDNQQHEFQMALSIQDKSQTIDLAAINKINIDGLYEQKVNSVYCFGITFILLHELSHFALGHMDKPLAECEDEINADFSAFWDIYSDINDVRRFSANIGILCMMFSLLMLNPTMTEDGIHPREDKRIFDIYDKIRDENSKYTVLLVRLFKIWADTYDSTDFPLVIDDSESSLQTIRNYFASKPSNTQPEYDI